MIVVVRPAALPRPRALDSAVVAPRRTPCRIRQSILNLTRSLTLTLTLDLDMVTFTFNPRRAADAHTKTQV